MIICNPILEELPFVAIKTLRSKTAKTSSATAAPKIIAPVSVFTRLYSCKTSTVIEILVAANTSP